MFVSQRGNTAAGDIVAGDQYKTENHFHALTSPLASLYQKLRAASQASPEKGFIFDQLEHYCNVATDGDVRGLEDKLTAADRSDLIEQASRLKQFAAKTVMKWQTSGAAQSILLHILGKMHTEFLLHVTPAIQEGVPRQQVDALIGEKVIQPIELMLGDNDLGLSPADLLGLLFFLGGNCHIRWDKC
jgi:hypothetical protein